MNWKKTAIWLWPPCALLIWAIVHAILGMRLEKMSLPMLLRMTENYYFFFTELLFPQVTIPFLALFALSVSLWLERPSRKTFLYTLLVSWVFLGWPGMDILIVSHFRHTLFPYEIIPLSVRQLIMVSILVFPYVFFLFRLALHNRKLQVG
jgi:hypothetical protein